MIRIASYALLFRYAFLHCFVKSSDGSNDMGHMSTVKSIYQTCTAKQFNFSIRGFKFYKRFFGVAFSLRFKLLIFVNFFNATNTTFEVN